MLVHQLSQPNWRRPVVTALGVASALAVLSDSRGAQDAAGFAGFGQGVAAAPGTIFVAASPDDEGTRRLGRIHVFERRGPAWVETDTLAAPDAIAEDSFGVSIAVDGDTLVVGAQFSDVHGEDAGVAYVFERREGRWRDAAVLAAADADAGDQFGLTVSVSGLTVVVGARLRNDGGRNAGAAYVFEHREGTWRQTAKLTASDPARGDLFGRAALDGDRLLVSADLNDDLGHNAGKAYAFERQGGNWVELAKIMARDGAAGDEFGLSLAQDAGVAVFGAIGADAPSSVDAGAAYVFEWRNGRWTQTGRLTANDVESKSGFGWAVAIGDNLVVVGAPFHSARGRGTGAAYVFDRRAAGWTEAGRLVASDAAPHRMFGSSVAVTAGTVVVGALLDGAGKHPGAAYVFERRDGAWTEAARLLPPRRR